MIIVTLERWLQAHAPRFLDGCRRDLDALAAALAASDFAAVGKVGDRLRAVAPGFGMAPLADVGAELGEAARDRDPARVRDCMLKVARYLAAVRIVYR
jgi:hypothetical protein